MPEARRRLKGWTHLLGNGIIWVVGEGVGHLCCVSGSMGRNLLIRHALGFSIQEHEGSECKVSFVRGREREREMDGMIEDGG